MSTQDHGQSEVDPLMMVDSGQLDRAAKSLRAKVGAEAAILRNGVKANAPQLEAAAEILRGGPKSVITSASGGARVTLNDEQELPGWIAADRQEDPEVLRFDTGILAGSTYRILRDGTYREDPR